MVFQARGAERSLPTAPRARQAAGLGGRDLDRGAWAGGARPRLAKRPGDQARL